MYTPFTNASAFFARAQPAAVCISSLPGATPTSLVRLSEPLPDARLVSAGLTVDRQDKRRRRCRRCCPRVCAHPHHLLLPWPLPHRLQGPSVACQCRHCPKHRHCVASGLAAATSLPLQHLMSREPVPRHRAHVVRLESSSRPGPTSSAQCRIVCRNSRVVMLTSALPTTDTRRASGSVTQVCQNLFYSHMCCACSAAAC